MDIQDQYLIIVGSVRGALATTNCKKGKTAKYNLEESSNTSEITVLKWGRSSNEVIVGYKNGSIKFFNIIDNAYKKTISNIDGSGAVVGLSPIEKTVVIGRYSGIVNVWSRKKIDKIDLNLQDESTLECMEINHMRNNVIATGGSKNDLKLWDLDTKQCIFKAKSLGHDSLNLPIPTSVKSISFFLEDEKLTACATKEGYVLLYDERAQRRPIIKFIEPKASYTVISTAYREKQCLAGTTKGYLQLIDLRAPAKCLKTFKSFTGSVTDIACDPFKPIVASTSLDRFLRIHNMETKELIHKEYLKQSLTKLILRPIIKEEDKNEEELKTADDQITTNKEEDSENIDEEYENLFNSMETISEKIQKPKRKNTEIATKKKKVKK